MPGLEDTGAACTVCGAALAPDQRYCVECGQRRGRSDLPMAPVAVQYDEPPAEGSRHSRLRMSPNIALIGGVGVLLLALGVGVLIGRTGSAAATKAPPVQVVTVAGAAGAAAGSAAATPATSGTTGPAPAAAAAATTGKAAKATTHVSSATVTSSTVTKAIETTRPLTGPNRPGYHNGKFTGNFFGP
jgi:hypothetical protein